MSLCQIHREIESKVMDFSAHVPLAGEESITDYLFWKWSLANRSQSHFTAKSFTKSEENKTTGADFEMEIWFVGDSYSLPLLIQAKKISSEHKSYRSAFSYPNDTKQQINTLLRYASQYKRVPLYILYSQSALCPYSKTPDCGVYIASAFDIERFANLPNRTRLSKSKILDRCIHFHQLFCSLKQDDINNPVSIQTITNRLEKLLSKKSVLKSSFTEQIENSKTEILPDYVRLISESTQQQLDSDRGLRQNIQNMIKNNCSIETRKVVVVDIR